LVSWCSNQVVHRGWDMRQILAVTLFVLSAAPNFAADPIAPKPLPKDEQDVIFFEARRPLRIRLHLQVAGKSFQAHWDEIMEHLFRFLDENGDGRLSAKEAEHAPSVLQL